MATLYITRFNLQKFYILPVKCISMFYVDIRKQSEYLFDFNKTDVAFNVRYEIDLYIQPNARF